MPIEKQKLSTLNKLIDHGADTEKKITAMGIQEIIAVSRITVPEIHIITELQDAIKSRTTIAYLADADKKSAEKDAERKPERPAADERNNDAGKENTADSAAGEIESRTDRGRVTGSGSSNSEDEAAAYQNNADNESPYTKESEVRKHDRYRF